jgi:hypothetical protein
MDEVFIIFQERQLSTDPDYQDDGFMIIWDSEELGRNLTTCELIEAVKRWDGELYKRIVAYVSKELELKYGENPDNEDLDSMYFDEVFEFIEKDIGEGLFYKFHYQSVSFVYRVVATLEEAEKLVKYYSENQAYKNQKFYYTRFRVD